MSTSEIDKLPAYFIPAPRLEKKSVGTSASSKGLYFIPSSYSWDTCWELAVDLQVEVNTSTEGVVIVACMDLQEFGTGESLEIAIQDLLTSLSDYFESLESRQEKLGTSAIEDLGTLRRLLRKQGGRS